MSLKWSEDRGTDKRLLRSFVLLKPYLPTAISLRHPMASPRGMVWLEEVAYDDHGFNGGASETAFRAFGFFADPLAAGAESRLGGVEGGGSPQDCAFVARCEISRGERRG